MVRLIGAALVAAGCAWMGFRAADGLRGRVRALENMAAGLTLLEQELELEGLPLPQLMERLADRTDGPARELFSGCRLGLERLDVEEFSHLWRRLAEQRTELGQAGQLCLYPLGETLGRCGSAAQVRAVSAARRRIERLAAQAEEEDRRQRKVYQVMGLSGGAFLVILLL